MPVYAEPITKLVTEFYSLSRPVGLVIGLEQCQQAAVDAARYFAAYGSLETVQPSDENVPRTPTNILQVSDIGTVGLNGTITVGADALVTLAEWAIIRPLFALYVERENAMHLEASRANGVEFFGRSVSEIQADITAMEEAIPQRAFVQPILTV